MTNMVTHKDKCIAGVQVTLPLSVAFSSFTCILQEALLRSFWATEWWPRFTNDWVLMHFVSNTRLDILKTILHGQPRIPDPRPTRRRCAPEMLVVAAGFKVSWPSVWPSVWNTFRDLRWQYVFFWGLRSIAMAITSQPPGQIVESSKQKLCRISTVYSAPRPDGKLRDRRMEQRQAVCSPDCIWPRLRLVIPCNWEQKRWVWNLMDPPGGVMNQLTTMYYDVFFHVL